MKEQDMLEVQAQRFGVFISDLKRLLHNREMLEQFLDAPDAEYRVEQWSEAVSYLCAAEETFGSVGEAKKFLRAWYEQKK